MYGFFLVLVILNSVLILNDLIPDQEHEEIVGITLNRLEEAE